MPFDLSVAAWLAVGIPLAWGVWITLEKALVLFKYRGPRGLTLVKPREAARPVT